MPKRAIRRHHQRRVIRNRKRLNKWSWKKDENTMKFLKHTATPCSCSMCRNPRRNSFDKPCNRLSASERRSSQEFNQEMLELKVVRHKD